MQTAISNGNTTMTKEQWLEARKNSIGGSDIGSIFNLNKYKSVIQVWLEKTRQIESQDISEKMPVKVGKFLEPFVIAEFEKTTGLEISRKGRFATHEKYPFMSGTIDAEGIDIDGTPFILECKTTDSYSAKEWDGTDTMPDSYQLQLLHYMIIAGVEKGYLCCLIGNKELSIKCVTLTPDIENMIISRCVWFWNLVETKTMPPVDDSSACTDIINEMFPSANPGTSIELAPEWNSEIEQLLKVKEGIKQLQSEEKLIKNKICLELMDNESAYTTQYNITYKNVHKDGYFVQPSDSRQLRTSKRKEK